MPRLSEEDQEKLLGVQRAVCRVCGESLYRNYCRECDEFFYECDCPPGEHAEHRTYAHRVKEMTRIHPGQ